MARGADRPYTAAQVNSGKMRTRFALAIAFAATTFVAGQVPPRIHGTIDLTIGGRDDAAEEYSFGRISGLAMGRDGRIYVADAQDQQIRVYSAEGRFLFRIGRKGSGPGEFTGLAAIAFGPDDLLWARDEGNFRYEAFTVAATSSVFRRTVRMHTNSREGRAPIVFDAKGNVVEIGGVNARDASPFRTVRTTLDSTGKVVAADTTREPPDDSLGVRVVLIKLDSLSFAKRYVWQPFGPQPVVAYAPNGEMALAVSSRYAVSWTTLDGRRLHLLQRTITGPSLTAQEHALGERLLADRIARAKLARADIPFGVPDRKPPLEAMQFSTDGELWIERTVALGQLRESDIYDRSGRLVATAEWPAAFSSTVSTPITGRVALGVARDSLDLERVIRVRFK
jgi:hypothetical protein